MAVVTGAAVVRAAGGIVWRHLDGSVEVLLVHRPRYDDWSFPKGKCHAGEADEACAVREVQEETGLLCAPGHELPAVSYTDGRGHPKVVRYWEMVVAEDVGFEPGDEVDERRWLGIDDAERQLSYGHDVGVLDTFARFAGQRL